MKRTRPRAERLPTVEQIRNLISRAEGHVLSGDEAARLRAGVEHLVTSEAGLAVEVARLTRLLAIGSRPALDVDCPTCRAAIGSACVTRYGQPTTAPHAQRLASAALPDHDRNPS